MRSLWSPSGGRRADERRLALRLRGRRRRGAELDDSPALLVPVTAAEGALGRLYRAAAPGVPPHLTVLFPFRPDGGVTDDVRRDLAALFSAHDAFDFRLEQIERFPAVLYLAPDPPDPFVALTEAVHRRWPESPPYEGAYDPVIPHLTVCEGREPFRAQARLRRRLPIRSRADEVWLMRPDAAGHWSTLARFPLRRGR